MRRLGLLVLAACAAPDASEQMPPDTLVIDAAAAYGALADRPAAPVRVERACPFECCSYSAWTTNAETPLYAAPDDTTAQPIATLPAGTQLDAQTGHALLSSLGRGMVRDSARSYLDYETSLLLPDSAEVLTLGYVGEGAYRVWHDGTLGEVMGEADAYNPSGVEIVEPAQAQWWAHVRTPGGQEGWLWMDRSQIDIPYGC